MPLAMSNGGTGATTAANARTNLGLGTAAMQPYEEGTFTVTATGMTTTIAGTASYTMVGKRVTVMLPHLQGTSNATSFTLTGIPAPLAPVTTFTVVVFAMDNGVEIAAVLQGTAANVWTVKRINNAAWTAASLKALFSPSVTYQAAA